MSDLPAFSGTSTGITSLDDYLGGGLVPGDNVIVFTEDPGAGNEVAAAFARQDPRESAWVTLGNGPVGDVPHAVERVRIDTAALTATPDVAVSVITDLAGTRAHLVIDGLGHLCDEAGPSVTADLYRQCCPRLFDMGVVAVWPVAQGALPAGVVAKVSRIAQCVFELRGDTIRIVKAEGRPASYQGAVAELTWDSDRVPQVGRELVVGRLGEGLRRLRRERGLTQRDLAVVAGVTPGAISQAEAGRRGLSLETVVPMCDRLGITLDEILGTRRREHHLLARRDRRPLGAGTTALFEAPEGPVRAYRIELGPREVGVPPFLHKGAELILVGRGLVLVDLGEDTPVMRAGDALMAIDDPVVGWSNLAPESSELFWVVVSNERITPADAPWTPFVTDPRTDSVAK